MPRTWPPDRMHQWRIAGIPIDQAGSPSAGAFEHRMPFLVLRHFSQPPMQMQLWLNFAGYGIGPLTAAGNDHRGRTQNAFQRLAACVRCNITIQRQRQAVCQIGFTGAMSVFEGRHRRTENPRLSGLSCTGCECNRGL